jgi:hypothetical protein
MTGSEPNDEVSDTTGDATCTIAGNKKNQYLFWPLIDFSYN